VKGVTTVLVVRLVGMERDSIAGPLEARWYRVRQFGWKYAVGRREQMDPQENLR
jgi:hypothetical protein